MSDYTKSLNNYFSNLPNLTKISTNNDEYSTVKTNTVNINSVTYILSFLAIIVLFVFVSFLTRPFLTNRIQIQTTQCIS